MVFKNKKTLHYRSDWNDRMVKKGTEVCEMNTNFKNMITELKATYDSSSFYIEAIDLNGQLEYNKKFDERLLESMEVYYKDNTIFIERERINDWKIWERVDKDCPKICDFEEVGKILNIIMKHVNRIDLKE